MYTFFLEQKKICEVEWYNYCHHLLTDGCIQSLHTDLACIVDRYLLINLNHYIFIGFSISVCLKLYKYLKTGREWNKQMGQDCSFDVRKMRENVLKRSIMTSH